MANPVAYDVAHLEKDVKAFGDYAKVYEYSYSDLVSDTIKFPIPKNSLVLGVRLRVLTAWAGGTPTVTVGDADTANGYVVTTDITITTLNDVFNSIGQGTNAFSMGKYYASAAYLLITHATGATAGKMRVEILFDGYDDGAPKDMIKNY